MTDVRGYFIKSRDGRAMLIQVPCPDCRRWHTHGDGPLEGRRTPVGDVVVKSSHCQVNRDDHRVEIQAKPYRRSWATPAGKISSTFRG